MKIILTSVRHHITLLLEILMMIPLLACGWGYQGHIAICKIAQENLTQTAANVVRNLLPAHAENDLAKLCPWADAVRFRYRWSSDLHFINTPDHLCSYKYRRDCKGRNGEKGRCLAGGINNYTTQLLSYRNDKHHRKYNLTEALLFLSHFIGDIHQPLHVGFTTDQGGNKIKVTWFTRKRALHHIWDSDLIRKADSMVNTYSVDKFVQELQHSIKNKWAYQVNAWEACPGRLRTCPNIYAAESIRAACEWAYKGVHSGSILKEEYCQTRLPVVELRIAQAGIRLASILNRIFV